jgi:hypothetical protein
MRPSPRQRDDALGISMSGTGLVGGIGRRSQRRGRGLERGTTKLPVRRTRLYGEHKGDAYAHFRAITNAFLASALFVDRAA